MDTFQLDKFEEKVLDNEVLDKLDKHKENLNEKFKTKVSPVKGIFGETLIDKGNGWEERLSVNDLGHKRKDYYFDGRIIKTREKISDKRWRITDYDDNDTPYLATEKNYLHNYDGPKDNKQTLHPNITVVKDNFTSVIDNLGRPVLNRISDIKLSEGPRKTIMTEGEKGFERGHVCADDFGGPATKENVVPQTYEVNHSKFKVLENRAKTYINDGHKVDIEVKINYADNDKRDIPSSFDYKIFVDGKQECSEKIYNKLEPGIKTSVLENVNQTQNALRRDFSTIKEISKKQGLDAMKISFAVSTVDNVVGFLNGDISDEEMAINIVKDTGFAGALGYGTGFISNSVASAMRASSHQLISKVGSTGIPAAMVSFGVETYDTIIDYSTGNIDGTEFAYDMGEAAVKVAAGAGTIALTGAAIATIGLPAGVVGGVVGTGVPIVASMVGTVLATEAYQTAVENGTKGAEQLLDKARDFASNTIEQTKSIAPEQLDNVKSAILDFGQQVKIDLL